MTIPRRRIMLTEMRRPLPWGPPPPIALDPRKDRTAMAEYLTRTWIAYRRTQGEIDND